MPESAEVFTVTKNLSELLTGKKIFNIGDLNENVIRLFTEKIGQDGSIGYQKFKDFLPCVVKNVFCKAKYIFMKIQNDDGDILYLHSHLRMTGNFNFEEKKSIFSIHFGTVMNVGSRKYIVNKQILYYKDDRKLGKIAIYTEEELNSVLEKIGIDVLQEHISWEKWVEICKKCKGKTLYSALLDQKLISGIGAYLCIEVMYLSKLKPHRKVGSLTEDEMKTLLYFVVEIPKQSLAAGGYSFSDYTDIYGNKGTFVPKIYRQKTDPNGNPVIAEKVTKSKIIYWVKEVQV